jgi:hypothetical protein
MVVRYNAWTVGPVEAFYREAATIRDPRTGAPSLRDSGGFATGAGGQRARCQRRRLEPGACGHHHASRHVHEASLAGFGPGWLAMRAQPKHVHVPLDRVAAKRDC